MRFFQWIKKEFYHIIPPLIFFFVAFNVINLIEGVIMKDNGFVSFNFITIAISSIIVAKVLIVLDFMPFMNIFPSRPLIYNVVWKSFLYTLGSLVVRLVDRFLPFYWQDPTNGFENFIAHVQWPMFWGIQILFLVLFLTFVTARDLILVIGPKRVSKLFLGF